MKRYQIFISSTFEDLKEERSIVAEIILKLDHIPAGMELFAASNDEQFNYIKRVIDESDYYVLIVGNRYGSVDENGKSYTEKEYEYAIERGIPVLAFVHSDPESLSSRKSEKSPKLRDRLVKFRSRVSSSRMISFWNSPQQLASGVMAALNRAFLNNPRPGWERVPANGNSVVTPLVEHCIGASSRIDFCANQLPKAKNSIFISSPAMITANSMTYILSDIKQDVSITLAMVDYDIAENASYLKKFFGFSDENLVGYVEGFHHTVQQIAKQRPVNVIKLDMYAPPYYAAVDYKDETEYSSIQAKQYFIHEKDGGVSVYTCVTHVGSEFYNFYRQQILLLERNNGKIAKNSGGGINQVHSDFETDNHQVSKNNNTYDSLFEIKRLLACLNAQVDHLPVETRDVVNSALQISEIEIANGTPNKERIRAVIETLSGIIRNDLIGKSQKELIITLMRFLALW